MQRHGMKACISRRIPLDARGQSRGQTGRPWFRRHSADTSPVLLVFSDKSTSENLAVEQLTCYLAPLCFISQVRVRSPVYCGLSKLLSVARPSRIASGSGAPCTPHHPTSACTKRLNAVESSGLCKDTKIAHFDSFDLRCKKRR